MNFYVTTVGINFAVLICGAVNSTSSAVLRIPKEFVCHEVTGEKWQLENSLSCLFYQFAILSDASCWMLGVLAKMREYIHVHFTSWKKMIKVMCSRSEEVHRNCVYPQNHANIVWILKIWSNQDCSNELLAVICDGKEAMSQAHSLVHYCWTYQVLIHNLMI